MLGKKNFEYVFLIRGGCSQLFPVSHLTILHLKLQITHSGNIYTKEISEHYTSRLVFLRESIYQHPIDSTYKQTHSTTQTIGLKLRTVIKTIDEIWSSSKGENMEILIRVSWNRWGEFKPNSRMFTG